MDYCKCLVLLYVIELSVTQPVTEGRTEHVLKLPKEITNGTFISIAGEINHIDRLSILLSGKSDESCKIIFAPSRQNIRVISTAVNDVPYNVHHDGKDPVPFTLNISARTVLDHRVNHFLDLDFEGNEAGPELLPPCDIKLFRSIQYITINGIRHLSSLLFVFDKGA